MESQNSENRTVVDPNKLAFVLGGLAHVYVEPSRNFSIKLMEATGRKNPYGGTVAVCIPERGIIRKFYKRDQSDTSKSISDAVFYSIALYLSNFSSLGALDWPALQELQGRNLRKSLEAKIKEKGSADSQDIDEYVKVFDEEIEAKDDRIQSLEKDLAAALADASEHDSSDNSLVGPELAAAVAEELYQGEISDRVRKLITGCIRGNPLALTKRERFLFEQLVKKSQYSGRSLGLVNQIKSAGRDSSTMSAQLGSILSGFGFSKKQDGKHIKFAPPSQLGGIEVQVLPKTPSDHRAGKNKARDIILDFSISDLHKD